jgi:hypothetical protein
MENDGEQVETGAYLHLKILPTAVRERLGRTVGEAMRKISDPKCSAEGRVAAADSFSKCVREAAALALHETEGFEIQLGDPKAVELFHDVFPDAVPGDWVTLDGKWTPEIKKRLFDDQIEIATGVSNAHGRLAASKATEEAVIEEGKDRRSATS